MLDVAVSYNRYKFLGHEFLTWLWCVIDREQEVIEPGEGESISLVIGNRVVLENRRNDKIETITITGDDAGLEEGRLALRKGALVTELNLVYKVNELEWRFTIKGESLGLSGLRCPATAAVENEEDVEGAVLEKAYLLAKAVTLVEMLYKKFMGLRVASDWNRSTAKQMRKWIKE